MADYIVQKAVEADKVKKKLQRTNEEYARTFGAQIKMDGCHAVLLLHNDHVTRMLSRTGEIVRSMEHIEQEYLERYQEEIDRYGGIVLLGEAWNPNLPQNEISGLFRQHDPAPRLGLIIFDVLTMDEFQTGHSPVPYTERIARLAGNEDFGHDVTAWHEPGTYGTVDEFLAKTMATPGRDGIILRDPNGTWTKGRGTTGEIVKIKPTLTFDLEVGGIGIDTGAKTGRPVYTLLVKFGDKVLIIGSGVPHQFEDVPKIGQIVEIEAMAMSAKGLLREPRFKGIRYDKLEPDTIAA